MTASSPPAVSLRAVRAAYYAFLLWIPIETIAFLKTGGDGGGITLSRFLGFLLFGLALIEWRTCFRKIPAAFWMLAWYLAAYTASQLWIPRELDARFSEQRMTLLQMAALFLISANLFADSEFRGSLLRFYGWWVSLVAVGMMLGIFGGQFRNAAGRSSISEQDPNVAAGFFALGAICLAGDSRIFTSRSFGPRLFMTLLAISALILAILRTGSRGGLIVFVTGILGLAVCGAAATRAKRALIAGAVIGVFGIMVFREFRQGTAAASRLSETWNQGDTAGRTKIYEAAWSMVREKPFMGHGGAKNLFTLGAHLNRTSGNFYYRDTHNLLLAVLTEVGLIGAVPFLAAILYALWKGWRYGRLTGDAVPFALVCAQITINTSLTGYQEKLFWIVLAAAVACGLELDAAERSGTRTLTSADPERAAV